MFRTPGHRDSYVEIEPESEEVLRAKEIKRAKLLCKLHIFIPLIICLTLIHLGLWADSHNYNPNNYVKFWGVTIMVIAGAYSGFRFLFHFAEHSGKDTCCKKVND